MNFLFKKVHAGRDLFALLGELNQGPGDRPPKLKKGAGSEIPKKLGIRTASLLVNTYEYVTI